jgi:hypothetical protein
MKAAERMAAALGTRTVALRFEESGADRRREAQEARCG